MRIAIIFAMYCYNCSVSNLFCMFINLSKSNCLFFALLHAENIEIFLIKMLRLLARFRGRCE